MLLDQINAAFEPSFDSYFHSWACVFESLDDLLVAKSVTFRHRVFKILNQRMLIAHLEPILSELILIKQVLRSLNVILVLILEKGTIDVWIKSDFHILLLLSLITHYT